MTRIAVRVARTEIRRTLRGVVTNRTKILLFGLMGLFFFLPVLVFGSLLLSMGGEQLASGEVGSGTLESVPGIVTGVVAAGLIGLTVLATIRSVTTVADVDQPACLLISTPLRNTVTGLVLKEALFVLLWLGVPVLVLSGAFAWGANAPLVPLFALLTLVVVVTVAVPVGLFAGICIRHLLTVYEPVARYRTLLIGALAVAYFVSIAFGWFDRVVGAVFDLLGDSPLGWPGQLLLAAVPGIEFTLWEGVAGVVGAVTVAALALAAGVRVGEYHWFADPLPSEEEDTETTSSDRLGVALSRLVSRPVRTVTVTAIRRTRRAPARLAYVAYPLLGAFFFIDEVVQTGQLPSFAAILLALYVVWGAGALFTLNLLGDHGSALPAVLTSTLSGRDAVTGTVLAGVLLVFPFAFLVPPVAGLVSPLTLVQTVLLTVGTVVGVLVAPVLAVGIGVLFPRFGSVRITSKREAVMPSKTAFLVYSIALLFPAGGAAVLWVDAAPGTIASLLSALLSLLPAVELSVPETTVTGVAGIVLVAGLLAPVVSVRYAIRQFDSHRPH